MRRSGKGRYKAGQNTASTLPHPPIGDLAIAADSAIRRNHLYQSQKALDHADKATKPGGTVIVVAECRDGYGEKVFEKFMNSGYTAEGIMAEVKAHFVMGGHKAYGFAKVAAEKRVIFVTSLSDAVVKSLFARKAATVQEAVEMALADQGAKAEFIVKPEGSDTVPFVAGERGARRRPRRHRPNRLAAYPFLS